MFPGTPVASVWVAITLSGASKVWVCVDCWCSEVFWVSGLVRPKEVPTFFGLLEDEAVLDILEADHLRVDVFGVFRFTLVVRGSLSDLLVEVVVAELLDFFRLVAQDFFDQVVQDFLEALGHWFSLVVQAGHLLIFARFYFKRGLGFGV